jgi:hypothetical protein
MASKSKLSTIEKIDLLLKLEAAALKKLEELRRKRNLKKLEKLAKNSSVVAESETIQKMSSNIDEEECLQETDDAKPQDESSDIDGTKGGT